jgi:signal transduction histidine kinase
MSRRRHTLRGRLALLAVLTTGVWVGLLTVGFNIVLTSQLYQQADSTLRVRVGVAAATVEVSPEGFVSVRDPADDEALDTDIWVYSGRTAVERPRAGARLQAEADRLAGGPERFVQTEQPAETRLYARPVRDAQGKQVATVVAAVNLAPYRNVARTALIASAALAVLLMIGVYGAALIVIGRALAPVQAMTGQAARWSVEDATNRFGEADRPGELAALAVSLNGLLDRLAALLRHEQLVTEELSHELRTPLSLISAEIELLRTRRRTAAEREQAHERIEAAAGQMSRILETLLTTARSRTMSSAGRSELKAVLTLAADRCSPPPGVSIHVTTGRGGMAVGVDGDVVERIVAPLLENAVRYAASAVRVETAAQNGDVVIRVRDDGPGVPPELTDVVFEPGRRGADGHAGAGLGLSLARRLARAAGGDLLLVDGVFEVHLPPA